MAIIANRKQKHAIWWVIQMTAIASHSSFTQIPNSHALYYTLAT